MPVVLPQHPAASEVLQGQFCHSHPVLLVAPSPAGVPFPLELRLEKVALCLCSKLPGVPRNDDSASHHKARVVFAV